ncbi:ribosome-binding ATPase YchF (GTP1/OBG family) [Methanocalculus alkaliphilus]|uniref:redox-regulated ATPase YchF n=1 Tax=Methanocalculus alkaliphilus TaxID=768730 RepID=UPI00209E65DC|nr:redox-regulated ATPase YchF [Methanocalculus alkaliphilus]MCP1715394.1 ribosome-binding ATPase YchF (GTP1/OBG family) [Methanocalculus alkaliphilus]
MITLALAGKPNCGKSTFFKAATLADVEIANYPFTTIDANNGVAYVRSPCPCRELDLDCGHCHDGFRFINVGLIDVAGLVPDAHKGKGLGNQFLDNLRAADAIIQIVDASGGTDAEGNPVDPGSHDPMEDIRFLRFEMAMWVAGIIEKHLPRLARAAQGKEAALVDLLAEGLAGLSMTADDIRSALAETDVDLFTADGDALCRFADALIAINKPMVTVANKADLASPDLLAAFPPEVVRTTAAAELALRGAVSAGVISYLPGDPDFTVKPGGTLTPQQEKGLSMVRAVMQRFNGTGVQEAVNRAVFSLLDMIVVYPVEDETHFTDGKNRILPDAFLMRRGSTPRDLAYRVHTDIGKGFLYAVDARTKMRVKDSTELKSGDIIRIVSTAK